MAEEPKRDLQASISDAIKQGTTRTSIEDIQKKGFKHVKVLDNRKIGELIFKAVESVLAERNRNLLDEERDALAGSARAEFQKLMADQQKALQRSSKIEQAKARLETEMKRMQEMVVSATGTGGAGGATLEEQIRKMTDRQKLLIDKYNTADTKRLEAEEGLIKSKLKVEEMYTEIAAMKKQGIGKPSQFLEEINALKDQRDNHTRREELVDVFIHNLAISEYALKKGLPEPQLPENGKGVGVLLGDRKTEMTGIKVRYEIGNPEPVIEFPEGKGPAVYTPPEGASAGGGTGGNGAG